MELVFQGLTARTHADAVKNFFGTKDLTRVLIGAAFVTRGGVRLVSTAMGPHAKKTSVFAGIRNELTSIQGLEELVKLGVQVFVVDVGTARRIYHPKVYLATSSTSAQLVVGSANLTTGGLNNNVEASILLSLDTSKVEEKALVDEVLAAFDTLPVKQPKNVYRIKTSQDLKRLLDGGLVVDERIRRRSTSSGKKGIGAGDVPPFDFKTKHVPGLEEIVDPALAPATGPAAPGFPPGNYQLMWKSGRLARSNINLFTSPTAAKKNVLSLGQGGAEVKIAFQSYFRDQVFGGLPWAPSNVADVEEGWGTCELVVSGVAKGSFPLQIRHSLNTGLKTVDQNNVTTRLVWGDMLPVVSRPENLGRTLFLSRDKSNPTHFLLEID